MVERPRKIPKMSQPKVEDDEYIQSIPQTTHQGFPPLQIDHPDQTISTIIGDQFYGYTLRFAPPEVRISLDPERGLNILADSPGPPPNMPQLYGPKPYKVGILVDGWDPKPHVLDANGVASFNFNEPVYLKADMVGNTIFIDSFGRPVPKRYIRFDHKWSTEESHRFLTSVTINNAKLNADKTWDDYIRDLRSWRIGYRCWEIEVLLTEFNRGNFSIFPSYIDKNMIVAAVEKLAGENVIDRAGLYPIGSIGRPEVKTQYDQFFDAITDIEIAQPCSFGDESGGGFPTEDMYCPPTHSGWD